MNLIKRFFKNFSYAVYLTISVMILVEIIFRILPTSDSLRAKPVNNSNPYMRYEENRTVTRQVGFDFTHVNLKRINNYGFMSKRDFNTNLRDNYLSGTSNANCSNISRLYSW